MTQLLPFDDKFEQRVVFTRAKNWSRADASRNYGHIGMKITFALIGPAGAITWLVYPRWYVQPSRDAWQGLIRDNEPRDMPDAWDLGYHAYEPQYEDQTSCTCDLLKGGKCYSDGTLLGAKELIEGFIAGGDEWIWRKLREVYESRFNNAPYPSFAPEYEPHPDDKV